MIGPKQEAQAALFYEFSLQDHVPQDHLLRSIDRFVDLSDIRQYLAKFYSHTGRPSVDPELLIRMLLVGYCLGIRSERRLCEEVHLNLAYRWFCRLDLSDRVPDHSTFSKNRHGRFRESDLLRHLFETTVARCIEEGLVSGQRMAIDASLIEADANKQNSTPKEEWDVSTIDPADAPRAVREYLDTLDEAAFGAASEVQPKFTSHSDPASQWTAARKGPAFFSYSDNYLIDTDHGVIVDVEATRSIQVGGFGPVSEYDRILSFSVSEDKIARIVLQSHILTWDISDLYGNPFNIACERLPYLEGKKDLSVSAKVLNVEIEIPDLLDCDGYDPPDPWWTVTNGTPPQPPQ